MDIVKLLSRSSKHQPSNKQYDFKPKIPSAGKSANPQLYNDRLPESRGTKRKRGTVPIPVETGIEEQEDDDEVIDYFATSKSKESKENKEKKGQNKHEAKTEESQPDKGSAPEEKPDRFESEDCKGIMRSHRLKMTLLPSSQKVSRKAKKNTKSDKNKSSSKTKQEPKPLLAQPLTEFQHLRSVYGISKRVAENIAKQGYKVPTEVQMGSLPLLLDHKYALGEDAKSLGDARPNFLAVAPTGSGKTMAFLIPVVDHLIRRRHSKSGEEEGSPKAVVIVPTKELASQIVNEGKKLTLGTGIKVVEMRKGMRIVEASDDITDNISASEALSEAGSDDTDDNSEAANDTKSQPISKADILVTTPLTLLNSLYSNPARDPAAAAAAAPLPAVTELVLDEADVLLDPLFREQTLGIWAACSSPALRVTLWSATMGSNVETLALSTIESRAYSSSSFSSSSSSSDTRALAVPPPPGIVRLVVGLKDSAVPNISHRLVYAATEAGKLLALRQLLRPTASSRAGGRGDDGSAASVLRPPFLVFTQTIQRAVALHSELLYDIPAPAVATTTTTTGRKGNEVGENSRIAVLHSSLSSSARARVMARFRAGDIWVLVATDLLARGIDFRGVNGVVNYDVPTSAAAYVHRVGRTGRAGRAGGLAVTLYTDREAPYVRSVANAIAASERAKARGKVAGDKARDGADGELAAQLRVAMELLPKVAKKDRQELKRRGMLPGKAGGGATRRERDGGRISTKSGYERRLEDRRSGAARGSKRRKEGEVAVDGKMTERADGGGDDDDEWGGFD